MHKTKKGWLWLVLGFSLVFNLALILIIGFSYLRKSQLLDNHVDIVKLLIGGSEKNSSGKSSSVPIDVKSGKKQNQLISQIIYPQDKFTLAQKNGCVALTNEKKLLEVDGVSVYAPENNCEQNTPIYFFLGSKQCGATGLDSPYLLKAKQFADKAEVNNEIDVLEKGAFAVLSSACGSGYIGRAYTLVKQDSSLSLVHLGRVDELSSALRLNHNYALLSSPNSEVDPAVDPEKWYHFMPRRQRLDLLALNSQTASSTKLVTIYSHLTYSPRSIASAINYDPLVRVSPDGRYLLYADSEKYSPDEDVMLFNLEDRQPSPVRLYTLGTSSKVESLAFDERGNSWVLFSTFGLDNQKDYYLTSFATEDLMITSQPSKKIKINSCDPALSDAKNLYLKVVNNQAEIYQLMPTLGDDPNDMDFAKVKLRWVCSQVVGG